MTDASPQGIGAILCCVDVLKNQKEPWAALEVPLRKEDTDWLGVEWAAAASQSAMEGWAILLAVRFWKRRLKYMPLLIRSDSTAALAMTSRLSSPSPTLNWIGAELALKLEVMNVPRIVVHHHGGPAQCGSRLVVTTSWESGGDAGETEGHQDPPLRWRDAAQIRFAAAWRGTAPVGRREQLCAPSI